MYDHGFLKLALALGKTSLSDKQKIYMRDGIKAVINKAIETSIQQAYDKKSEWKVTMFAFENKMMPLRGLRAPSPAGSPLECFSWYMLSAAKPY